MLVVTLFSLDLWLMFPERWSLTGRLHPLPRVQIGHRRDGSELWLGQSHEPPQEHLKSEERLFCFAPDSVIHCRCWGNTTEQETPESEVGAPWVRKAALLPPCPQLSWKVRYSALGSHFSFSQLILEDFLVFL